MWSALLDYNEKQVVCIYVLSSCWCFVSLFRVVHTLTHNFRKATWIVRAPLPLPIEPNHVLLKIIYAGVNASDVSQWLFLQRSSMSLLFLWFHVLLFWSSVVCAFVLNLFSLIWISLKYTVAKPSSRRSMKFLI